MNFNPYSRSHLGNPYPVYSALREERPVHLNERPRFWTISRFADVQAALRNYEHIFAYFSDIIAQRRSAPRDDLVTALVQADIEGAGITDDEILGFCALLLIAGNETTTNLLGNAVLLLGRNPDARWQIVSDMSLLPAAVEEVLRFDGPVPTLTRTVKNDIELHGSVIPAGEKVLLLLAAANRDPRVFDDPERFDIHRQGPNHIEFGSGIHYCMGASVARLEARIVFEELLARFPGYELASTDLTYFNTPSIRGPVRLPVTLRR